jgi:short-subunit dehydrogenase
MSRSSGSFLGRLVYISGGSSGIGRAAAEAFLAEGARVVLFARGTERLGAVGQALNVRYPKAVHTFRVDVSNRKNVDDAIGKAVTSAGAPDILVTCAGTAYPDYFQQLPFQEYQNMVDINITGTWNFVQSSLAHMSSGGHIVTVSSVAGFVGTFGYTAYGATKFAVMGFSEALRGELKPRGIGVSVLCPPDTDTPQLQQEDRTKPPETRAVSGNVRLLSPNRVAAALLKGIYKKKFLIIPGSEAKMVYLLSRFCPGFVRSVMDREVRRYQRQKQNDRKEDQL